MHIDRAGIYIDQYIRINTFPRVGILTKDAFVYSCCPQHNRQGTAVESRPGTCMETLCHPARPPSPQTPLPADRLVLQCALSQTLIGRDFSLPAPAHQTSHHHHRHTSPTRSSLSRHNCLLTHITITITTTTTSTTTRPPPTTSASSVQLDLLHCHCSHQAHSLAPTAAPQVVACPSRILNRPQPQLDPIGFDNLLDLATLLLRYLAVVLCRVSLPFSQPVLQPHCHSVSSSTLCIQPAS